MNFKSLLKMKNFTQRFIGLFVLVFVMSFTVKAQENYSLSFDDVDDYVIVDNPIYSAEEFSLNCWVKFSQSGPNENGNLIANWSMDPGGAYVLYYSSYQGNQTISAIVGGDEETVYLETPLQSGDFNTWNFISLTYDGTHSKLYINGDLRDSLYGEFGTIEGSNIATFGVEENYNFGQGINAHYGGLIDEISIWNKSLSNQEIQSYMSCPPTGHEESLVGYWKINEISSNIIYDASVNENHGIIYGGATLSEDVPEQNCDVNIDTEAVEEGQQNYSMNFSENDGIFIEPIFDGVQNNFSISATVKPNGSQTWGSIFLSRSHYNDTYLNIENDPSDSSNTQVRFFASYLQDNNSDNEVQLWGDVDLNQWNNIVGTYNGETIKLYVNGELVDSSTAYGEVDWSPNCWTSIGGDGNYSADNCSGGYTSMEGNINNLHIWNKPLSQSEIQNYINCTPSGNEEGLAGYWDFNEGSGDTIYDISGNENHGIINGGLTYTTDVPENNCDVNTDIQTVEEEQDYSISFDGVDDFIDIGLPNGFDPSGSHTFMFYEKHFSTDGCNSLGTIIGEYGYGQTSQGLHYGYRACEANCPLGNCFGADFYNNTIYTESIHDLSWKHWAISYNHLTYERSIYLNGDLLANDFLNVAYSGPFDLIIGASQFLDSEPSIMGSHFSGQLDEITLWNKELSIEEVQSNITCPPIPNQEELIGYWNFNEGSGEIVNDVSGNGNHGIINGASFSSDIPEQNCNENNPFSNQSLNDGLVAYYPFAGNVNDESGNGNHGTVNGATLSIDRFEQLSAYEFNESSIEINNQFFNNGWESYSISCWFMTNNISKLNQTIFNTNPHTGEGIGFNHASAQSKLSHWKNAFIGTQDWSILAANEFYDGIEQNKWYFLTIVKNGLDFNYYVDGSYEMTTTISEDNSSGQASLIFGNISDEGSNPEYLNGKLDDIGIWNRALTENEVLELYMKLEGCTDPLTFNYNSEANVEDGSCYPVIEGCMNPIAENYITPVGDLYIDVNTEDGSCLYSSLVYEDLTELNSDLEGSLSVFETVEDVQDYSMTFDGVDDHILNNSINPGSSSFTFQGNIYFDQDIFQTGYEMILQKGLNNSSESGFALRYDSDVNSDPVFRASIFYSNSEVINLISNDSIETNQWYNITMTIDRENNLFSLYLDAELVDQQEIGSNPNFQDLSNNFPLDIGRHYWMSDSSHYYNGRMNDFGFWNVALTHEQIQSYMSCPPTGQEDGLVGYWNFNEGSGDTVYDISGNGNHGIIYGGAEFSEDVPESYKGCTDENALNFDESALCDNGSCVYGEELVASLEDENSDLEESFNQTVSTLNNDLDSTNSTLNEVFDTWQSSIDLTNATLDEVSDMNQTIASFTTLIDLQEGWNMIGYGCPESVNIEQGMSMYTDLVLLIKDNNGSVYLPEFNFNGIGDFTPGYGYQLKVSESIEDFGLCGDYTNTESPEITDIETDNAQMQNDINCLTGNPEIGDYCYGGIVFYVEEGDEGKYGYVISPTEHHPMSWYDAMEMAENSSEGNFNNWTLPNEEQCDLIYSNIGIGSETQYLYLQNTFYWMSLEENAEYAHDYSFVEGYYFSAVPKSNDTNYSVVIVRSFGNWTIGCMDSIACNYNPDANMADGSCTYADQGYDCDGFILITQTNIHSAVDDWLQDSVLTESLYGHISNWNVSNVTDMSDLFSEADYFNSDISDWDVSNVIDMSDMFEGASIFNSDISSWDVSNVNNMYHMFRYASNFNVNISDWNVSNVTNMRDMFLGAENFNVDISHWDVSNVTNMIGMFEDAFSFDQNISSWNISLVASFTNMFKNSLISPENKCAIQTSFSSNENWPFEWECPSYQVGDLAEGGIVFYVDETGEHGLVAAMEDLTEGATDPNGFGFNGYEWGCMSEDVSGADGQDLGTGYQNTMDIVSQGCVTQNGGITAAQAALDVEVNGYIDWYLPSIDELNEMYNTIGPGGLESNIGGFEISVNSYYWSSSKINNMTAWGVYFDNGDTELSSKNNARSVRIIRAF